MDNVTNVNQLNEMGKFRKIVRKQTPNISSFFNIWTDNDYQDSFQHDSSSDVDMEDQHSDNSELPECKICKNRYIGEPDLQNHMEQAHPNEIIDDNPNEGVNKSTKKKISRPNRLKKRFTDILEKYLQIELDDDIMAELEEKTGLDVQRIKVGI